jgi:trimethylamine:corrinoid methyltransferase-like protein
MYWGRPGGTPESGLLLLGAGWLEGGLCSSHEKFAMACDQLGMAAVHGNGIDEALNEFVDVKKAAVPDSTY